MNGQYVGTVRVNPAWKCWPFLSPFVIAFGLGAASLFFLISGSHAWQAGLAFGPGGGLGGVFLAVAMQALLDHDLELRAFFNTGGRPLDGLFLTTLLVAIVIPILTGVVLLKILSHRRTR